MTPYSACSTILLQRFNIKIAEIGLIENIAVRQVMQTVLTRYSDLPYHKIGTMTGNKDHATISHSRRKIEKFEYLKDKYNVKHTILDFYSVFESEYIRLTGHIRVYRSYTDEMKGSVNNSKFMYDKQQMI